MMDDKSDSGIGDSTPSQASLLADVVLITEEMLSCAHNDDWDSVTRLEQERRTTLANCFTGSLPVNQEELFSQALAAMLHMNEEMIGLLEAAKQNVAIKRTDQNRTKRSLGHYLDVEKGH